MESNSAPKTTLTAWQQRRANEARGVTVRQGDVIWDPVHAQALYVVRLTQTAAYVAALPEQPARAAKSPRFPPGDHRARAASKYLDGERIPWDLLTDENRHFIEVFATLTRPVGAGMGNQRLPGEPEPELGAEDTVAKEKKAKREKKPKAAPKGPRMFWLTNKEAKPEDFERGGGLYGNAGEVYKAARAACGATESGKASSESIANRLAKREGHESKTDPLLLTRSYLSKVVAAGFMKAEARGASA